MHKACMFTNGLVFFSHTMSQLSYFIYKIQNGRMLSNVSNSSINQSGRAS